MAEERERERERERADCFILIVFLVSCNFWCSVALSHGNVGLSVVYDCGISYSYSLIFWKCKGFSYDDNLPYQCQFYVTSLH